ncbi:MAG: CHC2 zinc finger domain-containing protein [Sedimenticola sp.]
MMQPHELEFLAELQKVKKVGTSQYQALCPAHQDHSPSLRVKLTKDRILIYCFAGCSTHDIVNAVGLRLRDLFADRQPLNRTGSLPHWKRQKLEAAKDMEKMVMALAAEDRRRGKIISLADVKRERLAKLRIMRIDEALTHDR